MNQLYGKGAQAILEGSIAWLTDNIKVNLLTTAYTPNLVTDQFLSIIPGGAITATSANLTGKSSTLGTANAANITMTSVSGSLSSYVAMYKDTGSAATSPLILLIDTATNLPITPNGGDITVNWDPTTAHIFTVFQGLPERQRFRDWLKDILGIPVELSPRGLWIPTPRLVQT